MQLLINHYLESLSALITANLWLAPFLALAAGILTSFTPCALSSVPLVISYDGRLSVVLKVFMGSIILLLAFYMFYIGF